MFPRRFRTIILVVVALICLAAGNAGLFAAETLEIGSAAPDFNLPGVDGKQHSLKEFRDAEILVVIFTCNHCPTAQAYEDRIKQLAADYKARKVALVAICPNDPEALRLDELGYSDVGDSLADMKILRQGEGLQLPVSLRRGESEGVAGLRPGRHAARLCFRSGEEAAIRRPN